MNVEAESRGLGGLVPEPVCSLPLVGSVKDEHGEEAL